MEYCLDCGGKLRGRPDKKFCDGYCRSHYNNELNKNKNAALKEINGILKKNAGILEKLGKIGLTTFTQQMLFIEGFDFKFFTHQAHGKHGEVYKCCYNYGYRFINDDELLLFIVPPA
ncbi:hypothetical protein [Pedobacter hartonius]|uniref:DUF2116 family Zn-ribbon domain-containing protein n=1 Tax=Pedobacter hartonius TaxID=425514 RepID=A0A1H3YJT6_9SPHI|nr:hypothetical protein [Pedobacter hartonius]SEA11212.1 hypothetical protein SAMN05443550_10226 [Pedobacter hartonius]